MGLNWAKFRLIPGGPKIKAVEWEFPFNCFCFFGPPDTFITYIQQSPPIIDYKGTLVY